MTNEISKINKMLDNAASENAPDYKTLVNKVAKLTEELADAQLRKANLYNAFEEYKARSIDEAVQNQIDLAINELRDDLEAKIYDEIADAKLDMETTATDEVNAAVEEFKDYELDNIIDDKLTDFAASAKPDMDSAIRDVVTDVFNGKLNATISLEV